MEVKINVHEAKTKFSKLLARVNAGEEFIIAKAGTPVARLIPVKRLRSKRIPGSAKGKVVVAEDFNAPLPEELIKEFEK